MLISQMFPHVDLRTGLRYRVTRVQMSDGIGTYHDDEAGCRTFIRFHPFDGPVVYWSD